MTTAFRKTALFASATIAWFAASSAFAAQPCSVKAKISPESQTVTETTLVNGVPTPTAVTLNGTPSDGDVFSWQQIPVQPDVTPTPPVTLADANKPKATFAAPSVGAGGATLKFRLTVTGCGGASAFADTTVNVTNVNGPPVASAVVIPSAIVNEGDAFTLDGRGSSDPDGDPLTYEWVRIVDGQPFDPALSGSTVTLTAPPAPYPNGLSLTYRLTVSDGSLIAMTQKIVTVQHVNRPPTAKAVCDPSQVNEGGDVVLDGSGSTDPENAISSSRWTQLTGGPDADLPDIEGDLAFTAPFLASHFDTMTFRLLVTDAGGLAASDECSVKVLDVTPPVIAAHGDEIAEATSAAGAFVSYASPATSDAVDGAGTASCSPAPGGVFPLGSTTVTCEAMDAAGNVAVPTTFTVTVQDTTPPTVTPPADVASDPTGISGATVTYGAATASDLVDGSVTPVTCTPPSGSAFGFGATTVTCSATDAHGNTGAASFQVTVNPFTFLGFFQPVENGLASAPRFNSVKNGATVPLKWKLQGKDGAAITDVRAVRSIQAYPIGCLDYATSGTEIDAAATGGTILRYDATAMQFVFNWQTPKAPNTCWRLDLSLVDDTTHSAHFKLK
jgi:hypothetical protein